LLLNTFYSRKKNSPAISPASAIGRWNWIQTGYLPNGADLYEYDSVSYFVNGAETGVDHDKILSEDTFIMSNSFSGAIGGGSLY
jgi:hypothetical protein